MSPVISGLNDRFQAAKSTGQKSAPDRYPPIVARFASGSNQPDPAIASLGVIEAAIRTACVSGRP
jgi:hypothetical protein